MAAGGVEEELVGDAGGVERVLIGFAAGDVGGVVVGVDEEGWGDGGGEVEVRGGAAVWSGEVGRVDEDGEVGAAADAVDGVGDWVGTGVEGGGGAGGEVAAGGEADDADFVREEVPCGGAGAGEADGALEVHEGAVAVVGDTVFEDEGGEAVAVEPCGDFRAFLVGDDVFVGTAGADDDGRGGLLI